jgi:anti-anti-sigma factor
MLPGTGQKEFSMTSRTLIDIEQYGDVCILRCRGRLVAGSNSEYILAKMDEIKRLNCAKVLADFREVQSIGSMGINLILEVYNSVIRKPGGRFVLAGVVPRVGKVLELTRVSTVISVAADVASGLAAMRGEAAGIVDCR